MWISIYTKNDIILQDFLYTAGDYVVLAYSDSINNVSKIESFTEDIVNNGTGTIFKKEFRYSFDNETFSEFFEMTNESLSALTWSEKNSLWFQFRYSLLSGGPSMVKGVTLNYTTYPSDPMADYVQPSIQDDDRVYAFPITYKSGAKWNPYKMNKAVRLYKDLNLMVNSLFGHDVQYYRVIPKGRSKDVFLMEYSLYEHDSMECVKVVVPNNQFPDNKLNMGPFGVDFEMPFEVQIDKDYFQAIYGDGAGPQKRDVIFFPKTSRIYEVSSSYLFRDFMNEPLYFKVTLIKWLPKSNVESTPEITELENLIPSVEKFFGEEQKSEEVDIANPEQFQQTTIVSDPVRYYVSEGLDITDIPVMNHYLKLTDYQYSLSESINNNEVAVSITQTTPLEIDKTYYARFLRTSTQPSSDYLVSMKKLRYLGIDQNGDSIFQINRGESIIEKTFPKWMIFGPASDFYLYDSEYSTTNTTETPLFACKTSTFARSHQHQVVKYKAIGEFTSNQDRAYSAWFRIKRNTKFSSAASSIDVDNNSLTATITYNVSHDFFVGDVISVRRTSGGNFNLIGEVKQVINDKQIVIEFAYDVLSYINTVFPSWKSYTDFKIGLTYPRVVLDNREKGKGIRIDIIEKRYFRVLSNSTAYYFILPNTQNELTEEKWYAICVSFSNMFQQLTINIWETQWNEATNLPATSDLRIVYSKNINNIPREDRSSTYNYFITPSDMDITNIRVWSQKIESDKQPIILNQNIVKDASRAIVIDNAIPRSRLPYISYTH